MEAGTMRRRKRARVGAEEGRKSLRGKGRRGWLEWSTGGRERSRGLNREGTRARMDAGGRKAARIGLRPRVASGGGGGDGDSWTQEEQEGGRRIKGRRGKRMREREERSGVEQGKGEGHVGIGLTGDNRSDH